MGRVEIVPPNQGLLIARMSKTTPGNFFEDFRLGQLIQHPTPRTITAGAAMNLLQQALQEMPKGAGNALPATMISR